MINQTDEKIINILRIDGRIAYSSIASMVGISEKEVSERITELEKSGIIVGFTAVIDEETLDKFSVTALIELKISLQPGKGYEQLASEIACIPEVEEVRLLSGNYDLTVTVRGTNFRDIALFVSGTLAPMEGVLSTSTHFVLKRFKEKNMIFPSYEKDERKMVSP